MRSTGQAPAKPAAPRTRTRLERDERREQILAAARVLFSERAPSEVSTAEIAREAGVARGLLHHYFGGKRELYREVVRSMVLRYPELPPADLRTAIDDWLTMIERNRAAWLAALSAVDADVQAVVETGREEAVDRLVARFGGRDELRPVLRAYSAFAEAASVEWLVRRRLNRDQVRELLLSTLTHLTETRGASPT